MYIDAGLAVKSASPPLHRQPYVQVLVAIALGALLGHLAPELAQRFKPLRDGFIKRAHILMKLAPLGAFGAIAFTIGRFGLGVLLNLAGLVLTFYAASTLFVLSVVVARWENALDQDQLGTARRGDASRLRRPIPHIPITHGDVP